MYRVLLGCLLLAVCVLYATECCYVLCYRMLLCVTVRVAMLQSVAMFYVSVAMCYCQGCYVTECCYVLC